MPLKDAWRNAYRDWCLAEAQFREAKKQSGAAGPAPSERARRLQETSAKSASYLESQALRRLQDLHAVFLDILRQESPGDSGFDLQLVRTARVSIAVDQPRPGAYHWEILVLFSNGKVITLDRSERPFATAEMARRAARLVIPPVPRLS